MTEQSKLSNSAFYEDKVAFAISYAKSLGADEAAVAITKTEGLTVNSRKQEIESIEFNDDTYLGIDVYFEHKKGHVSSTDLSQDAIKKVIEKAVNIAKYTSYDEFNGLADKVGMAKDIKDLKLFYPKELSTEELADMAIQMEKSAFERSDLIKNSDGAQVCSTTALQVIGNSNDFLNSTKSTTYSNYCAVIAGEDTNMQRAGEYSVARDFTKLENPQNIGFMAADKTIARLNPRKIPTCKLPVIFQKDIAIRLFRSFASAISGGSLYRKTSFLQDSIGTQIFPKWLNIFEDPFKIGGLGSANFDAEGTASNARSIIKDGELCTYLLASYSSRKLNLKNTGHASGIYNWDVTSTGQSFDELIKLMQKGVIITETMGHGLNQVTGDYSVGASGFYVENGVIQYPIAEITVAANLKDLYKNIIAIGSDIELRSKISLGSVLFENMTIAGS